MPAKIRSDFRFILGILILSIVPFSPHLWLLIPFAVCVVLDSRFWILRSLAVIAFAAGIVWFWYDLEARALDVLGFSLLFSEGVALSFVKDKKRISLSKLIIWPLLVGFVGAVGLFLIAHFSHRAALHEWIEVEINSNIFPYFFKMSAWSEATRSFYKILLLPIFTQGIFAWFAAMLSLGFFISGTFLSLFEGYQRPTKEDEPPKPRGLWQHFSEWRSPDFILILLVIGLLSLAYGEYLHKPPIPSLSLLGWNLTILSLFPIFIQGISLSSFLVPRLSLFLVLILFLLLILNPIPVLVLAGLTDLWFDFRSRIGSNSKTS